MLSDREIKFALLDGSIKVEPKPDLDEMLNGVSLDFTLGNEFMIWKNGISNTDPVDILTYEDGCVTEGMMVKVTFNDDRPFGLMPGQMILAQTKERLTIDNGLAAKVNGRSSLGRLGLIVHVTADLFAPGWDGVPTLELKNIGPNRLVVKPGMRICSFSFYELKHKVYAGYNGKYAEQNGVTACK